MTEEKLSTLERLGGEEAIGRWVERFYDRVEKHPLLAPMFRDLPSARKKQFAYFVEAFGGAPLYTKAHGRPFLRFKHRHFRIGRPERDAWMELVMAALATEVTDKDLLREMEDWLGDLADRMINHHPGKKDAYHFQG